MADPTQDPYEAAADAMMQDLSTPDRVAMPGNQTPEPPPDTAIQDSGDPFEAAADQMKEQQTKEQDLQAAMLHYRAEHDDEDPGARAEVISLMAASGVKDPNVIKNNLEAFRARAKAMRPEDWARVTYRQPGLAKMAQAEPAIVPLVRDDTANLAGLEWALGPKYNIIGGAPFHAFWDAINEQRIVARQFVAATPGMIGSVAENADDEEQLRRDNQESIANLKNRYAGKDYGDSGKLSTATIATMRMLPFLGLDLGVARPLGGTIGAFIGGGAGAAGGAETGPGEVATVPVGAVAGVGVGQFVGSGIFNYAESVGPAFERFSQLKGADGNPLDPGLVQAMTQATGVSTGLLMAAGGSLIGKSAGSLAKPIVSRFFADAIERAMVQPGVAGIAKRGLMEFGKDWLTGATLMGAQSMVNQVAVEGGQAAADQHLSLSDLVSNPNAFALDVAANGHMDRVASAGANGFVGGLQDMWMLSAFGAAKGHGVEFIKELGRDRTSAENAVRYDTLVKAAAESKLLERSPEVFERTMAKLKEGSDTPNVMVPFERWVKYWSDKKVDPAEMAANIAGDGGKEFARAAASKGDVSIPAEKYFAKLGKTEHTEGLAPDVKMRPEDLTPNQFKAQQEDFTRRMTAMAKQSPEFDADRSELRRMLTDMAVKSGNPKAQAQGAAELADRFVTTLAVKSNISIREAARQANLGQFRIVGPKGEKAIVPIREKLTEFLRPRPEEHLVKRLETMSHEKRAQEAFIDATTGAREREVFDRQKEHGLVAAFTTPDAKGVNDNPTGGHNLTNDLLRTAASGASGEHPELARQGTTFFMDVKSAGHMQESLNRARKALGNENLHLVGATGKTSKEAADALEAEIYRRRQVPDQEGKKPPPLPLRAGETALPKRGELHPKLDVGALKFGAERAKGAVPPELVDEIRGLTDKQYIDRVYIDKVNVDGKDTPTGLMTRKAWDALPPAKHVAMVDAKGLKAINDEFGKQAGNKFLFKIADTFAHFGGSSFRGTHLSGDEFAFGSDDATPERLQKYVEKVHAILKRAKLRLRDHETGKEHLVAVDFRHGIGPDLDAADRDLNAKKRAEPKAEVAVEAGVRRGTGDGVRGRPGDVSGKVEGAPEQGGAPGQVGERRGLSPDGAQRGDTSTAPDRGGAPVAGGPETPKERPRGARGFFQEDVVTHIEGEPVVFKHGTEAEDSSFDFGQNQLERQGVEYVEGLKPAERAFAEQFIAFTKGLAPEPKNMPAALERDLGRFEWIHPEGFPFDEYGRDLRAMAEPRRKDHRVKGAVPDSLAEWKHNNSGKWWQQFRGNVFRKKGTKYFQFPRPEQSLEELQTQQVFTDVALASGAKAVDSVDAMVDGLRREWDVVKNHGNKSQGGPYRTTEPSISVGYRGEKFNEAKRFTNVAEAERFIRGNIERVRYAAAFGTIPGAGHAEMENLIQRERLDQDGRAPTDFGDVQPETVRSRDTAEMLGREYLQDREGNVRPLDEIPESKNLPGQAEAEHAPRPSEAIGAEIITPPNWKNTIVLDQSARYAAEGRKPGEKARGSIELKLDPNGKPRDFAISAFAGDKSTLLHEMSHFLSWSFHDIAHSDLATLEMKSDYETLLKWAGYKTVNDRLYAAKDVEALQSKGELSRSEMNQLREKQAPEERIAHGFEQYLLEGKYPNNAMGRVFSKFRGWMMSVYRGIEGVKQQYKANYGEDINLSNEVRDIFSRLLGQDDALMQARRDTGDVLEGPKPPPLPTAGMEPDEREAYFTAIEAAQVSRESELARRMKQLQGEETADVRAQVAQDVTKDLDSTNTYRAQRYLQMGELVDQQGNRINVPDILLDENGRPLKLDRKAFAEQFGKDVAALMPRGIWTKEGGRKADEIAPLLGFTDGSQMVDAFRAVPTRERAIAQETQSRLTEMYGPASEAMAKAAMSSIHNEHSAMATLIQIRAMARQIDPAADSRARAIDPRVMKATAERLINESSIGDLEPEQYSRAERQNALEAARLEGKGDKAAANEQRIGRLFNQMLYRAARDAADKAARVEDKLKNTSQAIRENLGKADPSCRDLHDAILSELGLGPSPDHDVSGALDAFMTKATADGHDPSEAFGPDELRRIMSAGRDWGQLSVGEASSVADAIQYIRHIAKETNTVELGGKRFGLYDYLRTVAERLKSVQKPQPPMPYSRTAEGLREKGRRARIGLQSALEDVETWAEMMDGGTKGPTHDLLIHSYVDCRTNENELIKGVLKPIKEAWENVPKDIRKLKDSIESDLEQLLPVPKNAGTLKPVYTRDLLWRLFMAYGSEGNRQRLNDGNGWSNDNIEKALSRLSEPELNFLQTLKGTINSLYPKLAEAYERRTGLKLGHVDGLPVTINGKVYEGSYDPIRYDSRLSRQGEKQEISDAASIAEMFGSQYQKPTLPNSATKSRVEKVNAPLDLSWGVVPAHLSQVIRDIAYGDWVRMVGRVMLAKGVKDIDVPTWKDSTVAFLGPERAARMIPWLRDTANARADSASANQSDVLRTVGNGARNTLARFAMGFNFPSLMRHLFDPYSAMADTDAVMPHRIASAYVKVMAPANWDRPEYSLSKELSNHETKLHDNLREELANIGPNSQTKLGKVLTATAFFAHGWVHHFASRVGFTAAYDQAIAEGATPEQAIQRGDDLVRRHFPSGDIAEKPALLRTKYGAAGTVMYWGYAAKILNVRFRAIDALARAYQSPNATPSTKMEATVKAAAKWIGLGAVGMMGTYFAGKAWKRKDDTAGGALQWVAEEAILNPLDELPFGVGQAAKKLATGIIDKDWGHEFNPATAPELALMAQTVNRFERMIQKAQSSGNSSDEEKVWAAVEVLVTAMMGGEGQRIMGNVNAQRHGEFRPNGALGQGEGAFYGAPKKPDEATVNPLYHLQKALK